MPLRPYIPIDVDNLPETFEIDFGEATFNIQVSYNSVLDLFVVDILTSDMQPIVMGEPLILNTPLWSDSSDVRLPLETVIPMDESMNEKAVTKGNFGRTVFLFIDSISPQEADQTNGEING